MFLSGLLIETVTTHRNWIKYSLYCISVSNLSLCYYSLVYPVHTFCIQLSVHIMCAQYQDS